MGGTVEGGWQRPRIAALPSYEAYISHIWRHPPGNYVPRPETVCKTRVSGVGGLRVQGHRGEQVLGLRVLGIDKV